MFVVNDRDADVELIDSVYDDLDIRTSESPKFDSLPDLHVKAAPLLSEGRADKQCADADNPEYLFHYLCLTELEACRNVKTRGYEQAFAQSRLPA